MFRVSLLAAGAGVLCFTAACGAAGPAELRVDAAAEKAPVSKYVYGQFIEHLGRCIYGGIWAEMLEDRKFYYPVDGAGPGWEAHTGKKTNWEGEGIPYEILKASPWQIIGPKEAVSMDTANAHAGEHCLAVALDGSAAPRGVYHPRIALEAGKKYTGRIVLRAEAGVESVAVSIAWGGGPGDRDTVVIKAPADQYATLPLEFTARAAAEDGRFVIECLGRGTVRVGVVSLMPADNVKGFRPDTLALLRELDSPVYRWPGGNFVSGYNWRDGVGDRDRRPPRKNPAWTGIEHNDVGIHEYMDLCELINTEPFIALNTGLGEVSAAAEEVRYITGAADTPEGAQRAANGRTEPWKASLWAVGNEMYGDWQLGHMPLEEYVKKHNAVVEAIRAVSPEARCVGVGSAGPWSETMLTHCAGHMEYLSEHLYWQRKDNVSDHVAAAVDSIEKLASTHRGYRKDLPSLQGKDIRLALDEWNYWYGPYVFGELGTRYFMRDALGCAAALHAMIRNSDLFFMANYAQTVNVIGAIKTTRTSAFLESTGQVLKLYRSHFGETPVAVACGAKNVDAAAAWTRERDALTVAVVNTNKKPVELKLDLAGAVPGGAATVWTIQNDDPDAFNDTTAPDRVAIVESAWDAGKDATLKVKGYSVTLLRIPAAGK